MAKAKVRLPTGAEVVVEGTPEEVARVLALMSTSSAGGKPAHAIRSPRGTQRTDSTASRVIHMRDEGFFDAEKSLGEVQKELRRRGHTYPLTSLSPVVLDLTRRQQLRRIRSKSGRWAYVKP